LAWREQKTKEIFVRLANDGEIETLGESRPFFHCFWADSRTLYGAALPERAATLWKCDLSNGVQCQRLPGHSEIKGFTRFVAVSGRSTPDFIADDETRSLRRIYEIHDDTTTAAKELTYNSTEADILDFDGTNARLGWHGRYWSSPGPADQKGIVHFAKKVGDTLFSIYSDPGTARTLAQAGPQGWLPLLPRAQHASAPLPTEVELPLASGGKAFALHFNPQHHDRIVIWWHGGPAENVSPRYNPYYQFLDSLGYGVLAVNYPGSVGFGRSYEEAFNSQSIEETTQAALSYATQQGFKSIVSWSVSKGSVFQPHVLRSSYKISALIDQAGLLDPKKIRKEARKKRIAYFGIHGRFDKNAAHIDEYDFVYNAGHDLTQPEDFQEMQKKVAALLTAQSK
jgi:dipeptidyl aminopeptidase/acylaminoacyl peptidase